MEYSRGDRFFFAETVKGTGTYTVCKRHPAAYAAGWCLHNIGLDPKWDLVLDKTVEVDGVVGRRQGDEQARQFGRELEAGATGLGTANGCDHANGQTRVTPEK